MFPKTTKTTIEYMERLMREARDKQDDDNTAASDESVDSDADDLGTEEL